MSKELTGRDLIDAPQDIRHEARWIALQILNRGMPVHEIEAAVIKALLAERERCAKMADDKATAYEAEADMWPCAKPIAVRLRGLADSIRESS